MRGFLAIPTLPVPSFGRHLARAHANANRAPYPVHYLCTTWPSWFFATSVSMCSGPAVTCRSIYDSGLHIALHAHAHAHAHAYRDTSPDVLGFGTCGACAGPSSRDSQERVERETQVLTMATLTMNGTKREWSAGRSSSSDSVSRWRAPGWGW